MRLRMLLTALLALVVLQLCAPVVQAAGPDWAQAPVDISREGHRVDSLFKIVGIMLAVLFLILTAVLTISMIAHREGHSSHHVHYHTGDARKDLTVAFTISAIIFFVVDGTLLVNSFEDLSEAYWNYPADGPEITRVQIMPQQWAWRFRLPGEDAQFNTEDDIVTFNELVLPQGKQVLAQLQSRDVIHSFFLPNVRQKQDANPGAVTKMTFTPLQAGSYEVVCAEMCGIAHYKMRAEMKVMPQDEFDAWHDEATHWAKASFDPEDTEAQWGWDWGAY